MQPPNLIVILVDDIGIGDFVFTSAKNIPTPNIDRLAKSGAVCASGYVTPMYARTPSSSVRQDDWKRVHYYGDFLDLTGATAC